MAVCERLRRQLPARPAASCSLARPVGSPGRVARSLGCSARSARLLARASLPLVRGTVAGRSARTPAGPVARSIMRSCGRADGRTPVVARPVASALQQRRGITREHVRVHCGQHTGNGPRAGQGGRTCWLPAAWMPLRTRPKARRCGPARPETRTAPPRDAALCCRRWRHRPPHSTIRAAAPPVGRKKKPGPFLTSLAHRVGFGLPGPQPLNILPCAECIFSSSRSAPLCGSKMVWGQRVHGAARSALDARSEGQWSW